MDAQGVENADGMIEVYQKVYELTKNAEVTVTEIPDDASSDYAKVTIKTVDFTDAIYEAMLEAVAEGGEAFADVPTWMMKALNTGGEVVEKEVQVRTHKSGDLYEGFNKEFFDALTGGFYDYITVTMTTCTSTDGYEDKTYMLATYDTLHASLDEYNFPDEGIEYTTAEMDAMVSEFASDYNGYDGIAVGGKRIDGGIMLYMFIDYDVASTYTLQRLDLVTSGYGDDISLSVSIDGLEDDGFVCETTDFGSGVLSED